tara:strand:- start:569 stop:841 length:273 start_codon:yes stop_codon:yes gene_type:complete
MSLENILKMNYKSIYFDEGTQKIRFTSDSTSNVPYTMKYVGKMNRVEFDAFIDFLWEVYEDNLIPMSELEKHYKDYREFIDRKKELFRRK